MPTLFLDNARVRDLLAGRQCQAESCTLIPKLRLVSSLDVKVYLPGYGDNLGEPRRDLVWRIASSSLNLTSLKIRMLPLDATSTHFCAELDIKRSLASIPPGVEDRSSLARFRAVTDLAMHRLSSTSALELLELTPNVVNISVIPGKTNWDTGLTSTKLQGVSIGSTLLADGPQRRHLRSLAIYPIPESPEHLYPAISPIIRSAPGLRRLDMHVCTASAIDALLSTGLAAGLTHLQLYGSAPWDDAECPAARNLNPWGTGKCPYATYSGHDPQRKEDRHHLRRLLAACKGLRHLTIAYFIGSDLVAALDALNNGGARLSTLSLEMHECRGRSGSEAVLSALQSPTHPVLTRLKVSAVKGRSIRLQELAREWRVALVPPRTSWDWWHRWE